MKDWFEAEEACKSQGSHLASVTNQEVHDYIKGKQIHAWIGGTDINKEGTWVWTDCSDWDFDSGWSWDQPNNLGYGTIGANCVESGYGYGWNDNSCNEKLRFVCSKAACAGKE